jgi:hypothetical protein
MSKFSAAFQAGFIAFHTDRDLDEPELWFSINPYVTGSDEFREWSNGWNEANRQESSLQKVA